VVVDNDIDVTSKTFSSMGSSWFKGTFDGLGHVVNGFTPASAHGMFGTVTAEAVIKNLALVNIGPTEFNVFSYDFSGTLDNVYVQGALSFKDTYRGVANVKSSSAQINNCIVDISGLSLPAFQCSQGVQPIVSNSYAIGDTMAGFIGYQKTLKDGGELFSTYKEFSDARISDITSTNNFNKYWNLTGDATNGYTLKFGNAVVGTTVANA
ncbi:MAG: hypothetical protein J6U92_03360, partial [Clostridia bacterium]|nr:hypothetical protein [Clostridia bacterium]